MYVYELARELGAEPRELIERAAADEMGHFSPNTKLSQEQLLQLRESYVKSVTQSRGSLFAGGVRRLAPPPSAVPAPRDDPAVPAPRDDPAEAPAPAPSAPAEAYDSPLLKPIYDPDAASNAEWGGPLAFDPNGAAPLGSPPPPPASPPPSGPAEYRWDDPPVWDPLPPGTGLGASSTGSSGHRGPIDYGGSTPNAGMGALTESDYERQYRPDDWAPPKPEASPVTRTVAIGVVGLIVIILASSYIGRELGIIGPGAERTCVITQSEAEEGEGTVEEVVCVDGFGEELSREVRRPDEDAPVIDFGSTAEGEPTRVVDMDDFCRGAGAFLDFQEGFRDRVGSATSMVELGAWYDENDGFGSAGHGNMVGSFGRAGPNPRVVELRGFLDAVEGAARSRSVAQAQMLHVAAEQTYADHILEVRNFSDGNC